MGALASKAMRKAQRFNAENRAHRVLDREKPIAAPKFESNKRDLEKMLTENPDFVASLAKKSIDLDDRLKQVYVTSQDPKPYVPVRPGDQFTQVDSAVEEAPKTLPLDRKPVQDFEYGFKEPERISRGRTTLRHAIEFISNHQSEPEKWTIQRIADEYKLKESVVANVLANFHTFEIFIPDAGSKENLLVHTPNKRLLSASESKQQNDDFEQLEEEIRSKKPPKDDYGRY